MRARNNELAPGTGELALGAAGVGLCAAAVVAWAIWAQAHREAEHARKLAEATSSAYQNSIRRYVAAIEDGDYLGGIGTENHPVKWPSNDDIERQVQTDIDRMQNISDPVAKEVMAAYFRIYAITVALVRNGVLVSDWRSQHGDWKAAFPYTSPMEIWAEAFEFVRQLTSGEKPILLGKVREPEDMAKLNTYAADIGLLASILQDEMDFLAQQQVKAKKERHTCACTHKWFEDAKRANATVPFVAEIFRIDASLLPFLHLDHPCPRAFLTDATLRSAIRSSVDSIISQHVKAGDRGRVEELYIAVHDAMSKVTGSDLASFQAAIQPILDRFMSA